jgi:trimeric autotransporter adhesin
MVYDRIGEKLFETADIEKGWDGSFNGKPMNTGVYVWYCRIVYYNGRVEELFGDVTLVR